jgi:hypothetical protein
MRQNFETCENPPAILGFEHMLSSGTLELLAVDAMNC